MKSERAVHAERESAIPLAEPELRGNEWKYVKECLDSGWVSSAGSFVDRFEREFAERLGARYAVATSSGTSALHVALLVAGVRPDEEVLVPALTFIAPANAVRYVGAWPVFMDADPIYWQMDAEKVQDFIEKGCHSVNGQLRNKRTARRLRAILPVHILGHPVDMDPILCVARRFDLAVVEDATESLGAAYKGRAVGCVGDIACFSFNGNKIITTGGGGMLVTDQEEWARKAKYLTTQAKDDPVEYVHHEIGYNYRLTNLQAAVGVGQMEHLDEYVRMKRAIAERYAKGLADVTGLALPEEAPWASSTFWLYTVLADEARYDRDSRALQRALAERNIQSRPLWAPIHEQRPYRACQAYCIETTPTLHRRALSLPCSVGLSLADQERVIAAVRERARS